MQASCQCGQLSAETTGDEPAMTIICHCSDCQKRSGSPFGMMAYFPASAVTVSGQAQEYSRPTDSGATFTTGFCPQCGTTLYGRTSRIPEIVGLTVGALDGTQPEASASVYEQSRHQWLALPEAIDHHPRGRDTSW